MTGVWHIEVVEERYPKSHFSDYYGVFVTVSVYVYDSYIVKNQWTILP